MSFEYITEKDKKVHKLSNDEIKNIADRIVSDFENYNGRRRQNLEQSEDLINEIFFKNKPTKRSNEESDYVDTLTEKYEAWKTKVKMCKTYAL